MQVPATTNLAGLAASELAPLLRVLSGQIPDVAVGSVLPAQVTGTSPGQVQVTVNGQPLVLKGTPLLKTGDQVYLRVPGAKGSLELLGKQPVNAPAIPGQTTPQSGPVLDARGKPVPVPSPQGANSAPAGQTTVRGNPTPPLQQPGQNPGNAPSTGNASQTAGTPVRGQTPTPQNPTGPTQDLRGNTQTTVASPSPGGADPRLAVVRPAVSPSANPTATTNAGTPVTQSPPTQVQVLESRPGNQYLVRIQGQTTVAQSQEPLQPGGRYLLQVDRSAVTVQLQPLTPNQVDPVSVATAVLKANPRVDVLPQVLQPLQQEIQSVLPQPALQQAVQQVQQTLGSLLPDTGQPLDAQQLQVWVEKGGLLHEAKANETNSSQATAAPDKATTADKTATPEKTTISDKTATLDKTATPDKAVTSRAVPDRSAPVNDLKGGLLALLQSNSAASDAPTLLPQTQRALGAIETLQALNVMQQQQGEPYQLQFPFPDGGQWRSVNLSFEPESDGKGSGGNSPSSRFRMLMNIDLTSLGEVWIDTAVSAKRLDATIYVGSDQAKASVSQEMPALKKELIGQGFSTVELNLRSAADLPAKQRARAEAMKSVRVDGLSLLDVRA